MYQGATRLRLYTTFMMADGKTWMRKVGIKVSAKHVPL